MSFLNNNVLSLKLMSYSGYVENTYDIFLFKCVELIIPLTVIKVIGDGSCFFHSILRSFNKEYIESTSIENRIILVQEFRISVAEALENINLRSRLTEYKTLGNGAYEEFSKNVESSEGNIYSLEALKKELKSSQPVNHIYIELISNYLNIDIYLISINTKDIYTTGTDLKLLYKNRNSIIILYSPGHYDIIGIKNLHDNLLFHCLFHPEHDLIKCLYKRTLELCNN